MPYRVRVLALLFLLVLVMYFDRLCIAVAGPRMQHDLKISPSGWGWVIGAFTLSYAIFEIPSGMLGDRIGPRRVLTRIVLWWSAFTALTGAVSSYPSLLAIRFLFGAGEAGTFPNSATVVGRWVPLAERARATGVIWTATAAGGILTPFIVVSIQKVYGWQASFWLFGSLGIFWAALWYWWFRDTPAEKPGVTASGARTHRSADADHGARTTLGQAAQRWQLRAAAADVSHLLLWRLLLYMGILPGHAPLLGLLGIGTLTYVSVSDGKKRYLSVHEGFLEVLEDHVRVLADCAERAEEIDVQRARAALQRSQEEGLNPALGVDPGAALLAMARAQARLATAEQK